MVGELIDPPVNLSQSINAISVGSASDSRSMYSIATARFAEMGLVRVGDGSGRKPCNRVHGKTPAQTAFAEQLRGDRFTVTIPAPGTVVSL